MFTIGEFARHGRVSVRMLRHYDQTGLLRPAHIDPSSGYRYYDVRQLARLNRLVALKELGFTLEQVRTMLDEQVGSEQLRGMLALRRAQLASAIAADQARLRQVEARLRVIEKEGAMPTNDIVLKEIPAQLVVELTARIAGFTPDDVSHVARPLCAELGQRLTRADATPSGQLICYYERDDDGATLHAAIPVSHVGDDLAGLNVAELPACLAATIVHHGTMDEVLPAWQSVTQWIEAHGYVSEGFPREVYLEVPDDETAWVTELQEPVARA